MGYIWNLWEILLWILIPFTLLATIKISLKGIVNFPENMVIKVLANEGWCIAIFLFLPWHIRAFAQGEVSPLPWKALEAGGIDGLLSFLIICIVNIWMLWTPAHIYSTGLWPSEKEKGKFARFINLLAGMLLMTPGKPVFKVVELL